MEGIRYGMAFGEAACRPLHHRDREVLAGNPDQVVGVSFSAPDAGRNRSPRMDNQNGAIVANFWSNMAAERTVMMA